MRRAALIPLVLALAACGGCRSQQLACDQDQFRTRILDLYTNQIMDNLVRVDQGLPIVQMDYTNITGTVTQNGTAGFSSTQTTENGKTLALPTLLRGLSHNFTNAAGFSPSAYQTSALTVTANPLINSNEVYNAYLAFVADQPSRLVKTCDPPPPGAAHMTRRYGDVYYWIPAQFKSEFLRLALVTTVQRGQPLEVPDRFDNTVVSVEDRRPASTTQHRLLVQFAKPMKSGTGRMDAVIKGAPVSLPLFMDSEPLPPGVKVRPKPGEDTRRFLIIYNEGKGGEEIPVGKAVLQKELANQNVKVDLDYFKPTVPNTEQLIKQIENNTQILRIQGQAH